MTTSSKRGRFITVEGQDGAGKTTHLDQIERIVQESGYKVLRTHEPGGTLLGNEIRELVLHSNDLEINALAELLLIFAARAQHVETVIRPALAAGSWVICDRFTDATYAYQGGGRGLDFALIGELEQRVQGDLRPDFTILFDVDIATGEKRLENSGEQDRFESEAVAFKERVRQAYLDRAQVESWRVCVIDATASLNEVAEQVELLLRRFISSVSKS